MSNIKLRKNAFSESFEEIPYVEGEKLDALLKRSLELTGYPVEDEIIFNSFQVLVNGLKVERDLHSFVAVKESDNILIAPIISRGDGGQLFKQIAILVITVAAAAFIGPGVGAVTASLITAGVSIVATLALNALIPPPTLDGIGGGVGGSLEESQMYSVTGQSNSVNRYGPVPKVYGRHRIFPTIAAAPYTEIGLDPEITPPQLIQNFTAIYDFGLGPMTVEEVKIGGTDIEDFDNKNVRLIDFNKSLVEEGEWDVGLETTLLNYSGDVHVEPYSINIDKNQVDGGPEDDYSITRFAAPGHKDSEQQIVLDFTCPQGLIAHGSDGTSSDRTITANILFSKVEEEDWHPFTDMSKVSEWTASGGTGTDTTTSTLTTMPYNVQTSIPAPYSNVATRAWNGNQNQQGYYGYEIGSTYVVGRVGEALIGDEILGTRLNVGSWSTTNNVPVGVVVSTADHGGGWVRYYLASPTTFKIVLFYSTFTAPSSVGSGNYPPVSRMTPIFGGAVIVGQTTKPVYASFSFKPIEKAHYKVKIIRVNSTSTKSYQILDRLTLTNITTRFFREPILTDKRHTFLELKIRATNQINGTIQDLSAVCTSVLDVYNPVTELWEKQVTRNPAWVFVDLLTGEINKKAISKSRLHLPSILEWAAFCDEIPASPPGRTYTKPRYTCDFVLDYNTTLQSMLNTILSAAQASLNIIDGKYGVLVDKNKTIPVQIFTPRNSSDFSSSRTYSEPPHALKIKYVEGDATWNTGEVIVYADGYDAETATEFEEMSTFACTDHDQAWRFGRYMMAQAKLRKETISLKVDFENLVCARGDFVQITQDTMKVGGVPARVRSVVGNVVDIDSEIEAVGEVTYACTFRSVVNGIVTTPLTVDGPSTFTLSSGPMPDVGDLIVIGELGKTVMDCIVKSIHPESDMAAVLTLVEKADDIYLAESTGTLPDYEPQTVSRSDLEHTPQAVTNLTLDSNTWSVVGGEYKYTIGISWSAPVSGPPHEIFEVYVDNGEGYKLHSYTGSGNFLYDVKKVDLGNEHRFKVLAVSAKGNKILILNAPEVTATPEKKITPPSDVSGLFLSVSAGEVLLEWELVPDIDIANYLIKYSPNPLATWDSSTTIAKVNNSTSSFSTAGRNGVYLVKAQDLNSNRSQVAAIAITDIPEQFDLNVIEEIDDAPTWGGDKDRVVVFSEGVILGTHEVSGDTIYQSEGYYYLEEIVKLTGPQTVRITSLLEAETPLSDAVANWDFLSNVTPNLTYISELPDTEVGVIAQYRTSNSDINPVGNGSQAGWTEWTPFTVGEVTGMSFQFRVKLTTAHPKVTPKLTSSLIKIDMDDRLEDIYNFIVPAGGANIVYSTPFLGPGTSPIISITQDNALAGDRYEISSKTLSGFHIKFYDSSDVEVARQIDILIRGY